MNSMRFFWLALGIGIGFLLLQAVPCADFLRAELLSAEAGARPQNAEHRAAPPNNDVPTPLVADEPQGTSSDYSVEAVRIENSSSGEALCIFEHATKRLAIYKISNFGLEVLHLRNCSHDFQVNSFDGQGRTSTPTVEQLKEALKKK